MLFSFPNQAASCTLHGGGNWTNLDNLKTQRLAERARWSGTSDFNASLVVDRGLTYYQKGVKAIALVGHNLTTTATITASGSLFRAWSTGHIAATYSGMGGLYGQGQMTSAPASLGGISLSVGDAILLKDQTTPAQNGQYRVTTVGTGANGVWDRTSTDYSVATTTFSASYPARTCADSEVGSLPGLAFVANEDGFADSRYLGVTVSDEDGLNENGYLEFGNLWIGDGFAPTLGPSFGWSLGYEDVSLIETSIGGIDYIDPRPKYRVLRFGLDHLTSDEWSQGLAMSRDLGTTEPLLVIMSATDTNLGDRVSFMGRLRSLSAIDNPDPLRYSTSFEVKELVG